MSGTNKLNNFRVIAGGSLLVASLLSTSIAHANNKNVIDTKIAFMPDIHFHDVYGTFNDGSFEGIPNSKSGKNATIRSMLAQLTSTRLFNEQYFALLEALDDAAKRGIKYIALPGDFSDDGQPVHLRGLTGILDKYRKEHGMVFMAAPGNHDPIRAFEKPHGEPDFLNPDGSEQRIFSRGDQDCKAYYKGETAVLKNGTICTEEIRGLGYDSIMDMMAEYGFMPSKDYVYYETPYSTYQYNEYSFAKAKTQNTYENRQYEMCAQGTGGKYKKPGYTNCNLMPDTTYLVEPFEGMWLLAIDANVFAPHEKAVNSDPTSHENYNSASNAGYNKMLTHKEQVVDYIADVVKRAEKQGKTLVAFSHYPMSDFYNDASENLADIFGPTKFQLQRVPKGDVTKALAQTGLKLHVGGHMHFNDTGVRRYDDGSFLFNVQAPSMAAYVPAYKILTFGKDNNVEVETAIIKDVPRFDELFEHYEKEHEYLTRTGAENIWDKKVLDSENYYEFTSMHIKELTRLRFLPSDWPCDMKEMLFNLSGKDMLILSQLNSDISINGLDKLTKGKGGVEVCKGNLGSDRFDSIKDKQFKKDWQKATDQAEAKAKDEGLALSDFADWTAYDLAVDFYRLSNADELAFRDISKERIPQYRLLSNALKTAGANVQGIDAKEAGDYKAGDLFKSRFSQLFEILTKFSNGEASDHFLINTKTGTLQNLAKPVERI